MKQLANMGRGRWSSIFAGLIWIIQSDSAVAEVAVLANRAGSEVLVHVTSPGQTERTIALTSGSCRPLFFDRTAMIRFGNQFSQQSYDLDHGCAYLFFIDPQQQALRMDKIGLGPSDLQPKDRPPWQPPIKRPDGLVALSVKIAVDDDEPTHRSIWEPRLRERVAKASQVLEQACGVKLEIESIDIWDSDDKVRDFHASMREFEREVKPEPAQLVIGFSSQYSFSVGPIHLGGTRGPLYPYILLKERAPNVHEAEKLELLVHEVAHFLGASHSPEQNSVMRPVLTVSQLRMAGNKVQIDPVNTLLMSLMSEELRHRQVRSFTDVSHPTKQRMLEIYQVLQQALPGDASASQYQQLIGHSTSRDEAMEVREILRQLTQFAKLEKARAMKLGKEGHTISGDELTARYVREAAAIAADLNSPEAPRSFLLAIGIFMDDTNTLLSFPATTGLATQLDPEEQRRSRLEFLGAPTIRGRRDLARHFFVSSHLLVAMGPSAARTVGLLKETLDSNGGTGFSFADMAANRAGIVLGQGVLDGEIGLTWLAEHFSVDAFIPDINDLAEGLQAEQLRERYSDGTANLNTELEQIEQRIRALPVYQAKHADSDK